MDVQFGDYLLKVRERQLFGPGGNIDLDGRSVDVLRALLVKPNEVVLKGEIFSAVWPGITVGENALPVHVSALRKALGPHFIETVHGRGYKYIGPLPQYISRPGVGPVDGAGRPVIAVVPFTSHGLDGEMAALCDAARSEIIERLSRFSLFAVTTLDADPLNGGKGIALGSQTRVDFLLVGNVGRFADRVRISAKLLDSDRRVVVWAEHYDRATDDAFAMLDELAGTLAGRLSARVESHMATRPLEGRTVTSYDHLVKGIWHFRLQTVDAPVIAEQHFRKARDLYPGNAEAIRWLSIRMTCRWLNECGRDALLEGLALGRAAAELDPASATCHAAHGFAQLWAEGVLLAEPSFRKAYGANPNDGYMLADVGLCSLYAGRLEEAYGLLDRAEQLNPFPCDWHSQYRSMGRFVEGKYAEAIPGLRRLPLGAFGLLYLMACHGHLGDRPAVIELLPRVREINFDMERRSELEPYVERSVNGRLAEGVRKAMELATPQQTRAATRRQTI